MPQSVVLVHGLRNDARMWRLQVADLKAAGHEPIAIDLPGHGKRANERFTVEGATDAIAAAVASAAHPVFLCGYSLGGYTSIHWAGLHPRPLTGMLVASCGTQPYRLVLDGWRLGAKILLRRRGDGGAALRVTDDTLREMRRLHPLASLRRIDLPLWLVNGSLDHFRLEERRYLRAARNAQLIHVPHATHMVSIVQPTAFSRILVDAVDSVAA